MIEYIEQLDRDLFLALNPIGHPWLDGVMWYISAMSTWIPLYFILAWWIWEQRGGKMLFWTLVAIGLLIALTDQLSVHLFKDLIQRYRPTHNHDIGSEVLTVLNPQGLEYRGGTFGFVSSHAANHFGIATFIYLLLRPMWWVWALLLFVWAAVVSYSRIYLGVHYPADILGGAVLGIVLANVVHLVFRKSIDYLIRMR